jgi:hypothetical protein
MTGAPPVDPPGRSRRESPDDEQGEGSAARRDDLTGSSGIQEHTTALDTHRGAILHAPAGAPAHLPSRLAPCAGDKPMDYQNLCACSSRTTFLALLAAGTP